MCEILEKERQEGKKEERNSVIINMLMQDFTEDAIVSITKAPVEEIQKIKNNL